MQLIIIGCCEFICLYLGLTYLSSKSFSTRLFVIHFLATLIPVLIVYLFVSRMFSIVLLLLLIGCIFIKDFKKGLLIVNISMLIMIGIFADGIVQYLFKWIPLQEFSGLWLLHIILFPAIFFTLVFFYKKVINFDLRNHPLNSKKISFIGIVLCITAMFFYVTIFKFNDSDYLFFNLIWQLSYLILVSILLYVFNYSLKKEFELKNSEIMQKSFFEYTHKLSQVNIEMQKFRHDYLNILVTMQAYIDNNEHDKLKKYFYEKILPLESKNMFRGKIINTLENIKILEMKSIIASKIIQAGNLDVEINLDIPNEITHISIDKIDLVRVLGIYLDNAIEASLKVSNPKINLACIQIDNKGGILLVVENIYDGEIIDLTKIFQLGFTSKEDSFGIGLCNSKEILSKYKNIVSNTRVEKEWFIQEVQIGGIHYENSYL